MHQGDDDTGNICQAFFSGSCKYGDRCIFSHAFVQAGSKRETVGSRAAAALAASQASDSSSDQSSSYGYGQGSSRSWADQSQDIWPEVPRPPSAQAPTRVRDALPPGFEVSGWQLPSFGDRLGFPEFIPSDDGSPERSRGWGPQSKSARRRRQRELGDRRAEYAKANAKRSDEAVAAALAFQARPCDRSAPHLDFPRSEEDSPVRPPAPRPTPRPEQKERASDGARGATEQEDEDEDEDEDVQEQLPRPACPGKRRNILSL
ncbi:unnamed protein product [Prorocentrum cordatum]|uniref:C3H1-type domain-containing protein n=1 Tax=Prorocentrum cordatum TaxID=2364126 RepID=A0ABN9QFZ7_9DINO|nr:unnamed protein product [Polarella glacialis]